MRCCRLGGEAFEAILRRRPEIAGEISGTLAHRRVGLDTAREEASGEALRDRMKTTQNAFLSRMRDFFGLSALN